MLKIKKATVLFLAICITFSNVPAKTQAAASVDKKLSAQITKIVDKKTSPKDTKKKKLKKLFNYVEKKYDYGRAMGFKPYSGWEKDFALEICENKKGSCYHFAALYAFLAKKATGYNVRIAIGKTNGFTGDLQSHSWTEVKINSTWYICDTNMDKYAENSSGKYFLKKSKSLKKVYNNFQDVTYFNV